MQIIDEYDYLISLIYASMHKTVPPEKPESISFESVLECGIKHEVANFAYPAILQLVSKPNSDTFRRWTEFYYQALMRNANQNAEKTKFISALHKKNIVTLEVQGTAVKKYYPEPDMRMMSDIDVIIPLEDLNAAEQVMTELGYTTENLCGNEVNATKNSIYVEIHTDFFVEEDKDVYAILNHAFQYTVIDSDNNAIITDTVFYLFHILHTLKHYSSSGVGIRRIMDLYYVNLALKDKIDNEFINKTLEENGFADDFANLCSLSQMWFEDKEPDRDISDVAEEVKTAEKHGILDIAIKHELAKLKNQKQKFPKLKILMNRVFLPKSKLYALYPFCKKHKLPTVLCLFYRAYYMVFNKEKRKRVVNFISRLFRKK